MPKALLSVSDKTGLVEFARGLHHLSWDLLASGGTARVLQQAGIPVTEIAEYTGSPEVLGGRVKTLHPAVHAGLLARSTAEDLAEIQNMGWDYIDLVAVNLYPFEQTIAKADVTFEDAIENIDIGGVTLIRASAKNHARVTLGLRSRRLCECIGRTAAGSHLERNPPGKLALKGFSMTARYDTAISAWMRQNVQSAARARLSPLLCIRFNPCATAKTPTNRPGCMVMTQDAGPLGGNLLQGKALSYNNLLDLDAAWKAAVSFDGPTICIVKHLSPCGIASAEKLADAYQAALASDPVSAYGGVIASTRPVDMETAQLLKDLFVECIAAPGFSP